MPKFTFKQIAIIAGVAFGLPALIWLSGPYHKVAAYGLLALTVVFVVVMVCKEFHKIRERRKLWPKMEFPNESGAASIPSTPLRSVDVSVRSEYGYPPKIDDFFGEVSPAEVKGWTYQLWLEEWAESYLGGEPFGSLDVRFATTPGVSSVVHEDREVFLIKTEQLNPQQIRQAFWQHFLEAAKEGIST